MAFGVCTNCLSSFPPSTCQKWKILQFFFDIVTTHNDETCYVKHVLAPLYTLFGCWGGGVPRGPGHNLLCSFPAPVFRGYGPFLSGVFKFFFVIFGLLWLLIPIHQVFVGLGALVCCDFFNGAAYVPLCHTGRVRISMQCRFIRSMGCIGLMG